MENMENKNPDENMAADCSEEMDHSEDGCDIPYSGFADSSETTEQEAPDQTDAECNEAEDMEREDNMAREDGTDEPSEEALSGSGDEGGGFFRKKKKDKDKEAFKAKVDELEDRVRRQMAEFDNFRKRTEREKAAMFDTGAKSVIEKILPVVDNFERGLAAIPETEKDSAFVDGMNKVYKQLMTELDNMGVKPIEAAGQEFNPDYHNAVMHVEDDSAGDNMIVEEFQKGYTYHDTVVRHSMVKVAN